MYKKLTFFKNIFKRIAKKIVANTSIIAILNSLMECIPVPGAPIISEHTLLYTFIYIK